MPLPPLSYAQRFEDFHLWRCFGDSRTASTSTSAPGIRSTTTSRSRSIWRAGAASRSSRTRRSPHSAARCARAIISSKDCAARRAGEATLYLQREFHGLSTTIAEHARGAEKEVGRTAEAVTLPMTTLAALCEQHAPATFEFLKVDVEGAEADVLRGADFSRFRPKVIVVEAIKPLSLEPAWDEWEPLLARHGYAYVWDDELNRYYVAEEARALAARLAEGPKWYADGPQIGNFKPAADDPTHPDHRLARLLARRRDGEAAADGPRALFDMLTAGIADLDRPASAADIAAIDARLFGSPAPQQIAPQGGETIRDVYRQIIDSDAFRAACGRIAASYAW